MTAHANASHGERPPQTPPADRASHPDTSIGSFPESLRETNRRLIELHHDEEEALLHLMRENEALTRDALLAETEIRRQKRLRQSLQERRAEYTRALVGFNTEREKLEATKRQDDEQLRRVRHELGALKSELASLSREREQLLRMHGSLQEEIDRLRDQDDRLSEDIGRLSDMKAGYIKSIAKYKNARALHMSSDLPA